MTIAILTTNIRSEHDVMLTRQRARQIAGLLGFDSHDQTRIATAVSEIARNAVQYAQGGKVEFELDSSTPQAFQIKVKDSGPGITNLDAILAGTYVSHTGAGTSILGVKRLMNVLDIATSHKGTLVTLRRLRPRRLPSIERTDIARITTELMLHVPDDPLEEMQRQNQELLRTLEELHVQYEEREKAQEATRLREQWLEATLRSIGDAVIATNADGRVLFMNPVAESLTGWTPAAAAGKDIDLVFCIGKDQTCEDGHGLLDRVLSRGEAAYLSEGCRLTARDGNMLYVDASGGPILTEDGAIAGAVLVFKDISSRIATQRERDLLTTELESLNLRLQRSMRETHHRVKNNLQMISALVEIQTDDDIEMVPRAAMTRIGQHTRSLAALHDLLTQQTRTDPQAEGVSARKMMEKLIPLLATLAGGRPIHYEVDDVCLPIQKSTSLAMLVSEMVSNAVKHGSGKIAVAFHAAEGFGRLEVCDDGPGFSGDFDPRMAANTGLVLIDSTSRFELGGTVTYENCESGGARVVTIFPIEAPDED